MSKDNKSASEIAINHRWRKFWLLCLALALIVVGVFVWRFIIPAAILIYKETKEHERIQALPDPVIKKDGIYWVPLYHQHLFAIPKVFLKDYSRRSTNGTIGNISIHANLLGFKPYDEKTESQYNF